MLKPFIFISCLALARGFEAPTSERLSQIKSELVQYFRQNSNFLPTAVRLAFHDCVGFACDGCINRANPDNAGLEDFVEALEVLYVANYKEDMSRADFWYLAGIAAVEQGINFNNRACEQGNFVVPCQQITADPITFSWGRQDCNAASPWADEDEHHPFPFPSMDWRDVKDYFSEEFGLNARQTIALMGAHTLGAARPENSGWNGVWIEGQRTAFNNEFYVRMVDPSLSWTQVNVARLSDSADPKWQWRANDANGEQQAFMLQSDVCLYKNVQLNLANPDLEGFSDCEFTQCPDSPRADIVRQFAEDQDFWIQIFKNAFVKMASKVEPGVELQVVDYA